MKTAIFGDIHGNFQAWQTAFKLMQEKNVERFFCTGDLVGYGPQPNKVVTDLRRKKDQGLDIEIVTGNHDLGAVDNTYLNWFNSHAHQALKWTKKELNSNNKQFLKNLPQTFSSKDLFIAHGTPDNPCWQYLRPWGVTKIFNNHDFTYCFLGHTHQVHVFIADDSSSIRANTKQKSFTKPANIEIPSEKRMIVNVGSIGQPRDCNPKSSFVIWDDKKRKLEIIRCEYDIKETQELIYSSQIPDFEGDRLTKGR